MTAFEFYLRPFENSDVPCLVMDDAHGGDPHILGQFSRVYRPDDLHRLVNQANAAPDLLAACKAMIDAYWRGSEDSDDEHAPSMVKEALAAISKAEGRS